MQNLDSPRLEGLSSGKNRRGREGVGPTPCRMEETPTTTPGQLSITRDGPTTTHPRPPSGNAPPDSLPSVFKMFSKKTGEGQMDQGKTRVAVWWEE